MVGEATRVLLNFSFSNFRSFRDSQQFSFEPISGKRKRVPFVLPRYMEAMRLESLIFSMRSALFRRLCITATHQAMINLLFR